MAYVNCHTRQLSKRIDVTKIEDDGLFCLNKHNISEGYFNCDLDITFYPKFKVLKIPAGESFCEGVCEHYQQKEGVLIT